MLLLMLFPNNHRWLFSFFEIAPEPTGHGLPLGKCEAYNWTCPGFVER